MIYLPHLGANDLSCCCKTASLSPSLSLSLHHLLTVHHEMQRTDTAIRIGYLCYSTDISNTALVRLRVNMPVTFRVNWRDYYQLWSVEVRHRDETITKWHTKFYLEHHSCFCMPSSKPEAIFEMKMACISAEILKNTKWIYRHTGYAALTAILQFKLRCVQNRRHRVQR